MSEELNKKKSPLFGLIAAALLFGNAWLGWQTVIAHDDARLAQQRVTSCENLANKIEQLRSVQLEVEPGSRSDTSWSKMVEETAGQIGINGPQIGVVHPGSPRSLSDSPYLQQTVKVNLVDITMDQLVRFCLAIENENTGIQVSKINLNSEADYSQPDKPSNGPEKWGVRLILTSYIYAPKIRSPSHK